MVWDLNHTKSEPPQCYQHRDGSHQPIQPHEQAETDKEEPKARSRNSIVLTECWETVEWFEPEDPDGYAQDGGIESEEVYEPGDYDYLVERLKEARHWQPSQYPLPKHNEPAERFQHIWWTSEPEMDMHTGVYHSRSLHLKGKARNVKWILMLSGLVNGRGE